ncbi:hypothetical protein HAX54_031754, partial [Datura stramonium]|nr:hypothetical protein [Datura stramonium]
SRSRYKWLRFDKKGCGKTLKGSAKGSRVTNVFPYNFNIDPVDFVSTLKDIKEP